MINISQPERRLSLYFPAVLLFQLMYVGVDRSQGQSNDYIRISLMLLFAAQQDTLIDSPIILLLLPFH